MARTSRKGDARQIAAAPAERIWNTAVYARLSLEDSGRKGADTIETQIELVSSYVVQRPYLSLTDTYVDNGESGKDFDRPAWNRLMEDIRAGRVDCICVKDLSRFSRNYIETCEFLEKIFPFMGVRFVSVNDGYDSAALGDKNEGLIVALKSLVNDQYLRDISRKISSSIKARRDRGEFIGSFAPFGYKKSKTVKGKLEPDETTAPIVGDIFRWRSEGASQREICKRLTARNVPCPSKQLREKFDVKGEGYYKADIWQSKAVRQIIANPVYIGHLVYGKSRQSLAEHKPYTSVPKSEWDVRENIHEPIVSRELWESANAVESERRAEFFETHGHSALPENIFKGFLVCGFCGSKLSRAHTSKVNPSGKRYEYYYYGCSVYGKHTSEPEYQRIRLETVYDLAFPLVSQKLQTAANLAAIIEKRARSQTNPRAALDAEINRAGRELEAINQRLAGLYENYADKLLTEMEYVKVKAEYEHRAEALRSRIDDLSRRAAVTADMNASENRWLKAAQAFQNPVELTREMLEAIVDHIEVFGQGNINVVWKFKDDFALLEQCAENTEVV